jgi:hypothetical protein
MADLRTDDLWDRISNLSKKAKHRHVAVAWLARGASKLLTLGEDDVLVVDMGDASVKTGRTDPKEVSRYLARGVRVFSVSNLHAKVFVFDKHVIVGSSNVSTHSRDTLLEAAIESSDPKVRAKAIAWIASLAQVAVTPTLATAKEKLYKPPKWGSPTGATNHGSKRVAGKKLPVTDGQLWIVGTEATVWPEDEAPVLDKQAADAKRELKDPSHYSVDSIRLPERTKLERARRGDSVITIHDDGEDTAVWAPAAVIAARKYVVGKKRAVGLHLERRNDDKLYDLKGFKKFVKKLGIEVTSNIERVVWSASAKTAILGAFELSK